MSYSSTDRHCESAPMGKTCSGASLWPTPCRQGYDATQTCGQRMIGGLKLFRIGHGRQWKSPLLSGFHLSLKYKREY